MQELERLHFALDLANNLVYEWQVDSDVMSWTGDKNKVFEEIEESMMSRREAWIRNIHPFDKQTFLMQQQKAINESKVYHIDYRLQVNGETIWVTDHGSMVEKDGQIYIVGVISRRRSSSLEFRPHADEDSQGSAGSSVRKELEKALSEESEGETSLLYLTVDNLATIMSWYSIDVAKSCMIELEESIHTILSDKDKIMRAGIDQFVLILSGYDEESLELIIEQIHSRVHQYSNPHFIDNLVLRSSSSGFTFKDKDENIDDVLNKLYMGISTAKQHPGIDHFDYKEAEEHHQSNKEQTVQIYSLQRAMYEDRVHLAYQPVIEAATGKVDSYECLLRIQEEDGTYSSAGTIIPIAEKLGFIDTIDQYVLETVIRELKRTKDVNLAFNVSNVTTDSAKWLKICTDLLQDQSIANRIIVEITETAAERDLSKSAYFVASLQALGVQVALDDFGAGHTSFRQLKSLSVDMLKIDGVYVKDLVTNTENQLFIKTLMEFTEQYGLKTIAECVESGEVAKMLMDMDVHYMQGYYFGMPQIEKPWAPTNPAAAYRDKVSNNG